MVLATELLNVFLKEQFIVLLHFSLSAMNAALCNEALNSLTSIVSAIELAWCHGRIINVIKNVLSTMKLLQRQWSWALHIFRPEKASQ